MSRWGSPSGTTRRPAPRGVWVAGLVGVALIAGIAGAAYPSRPAARPLALTSRAATTAAAGADGAPDTVDGFRSVRTYAAVAVPTRVRIPGLRIDSPLERLGLEKDGSIQAPTHWQEAGWYTGGPRPGQQGVAVIAGHVDSPNGPAVFYRLPRLRPGDLVLVDRADGSTVRFRVTGQRRVPKDHFPASALYYPTLQASLLLLTCGGTFDERTGHYRDNVVVSAEPA